MNVSRPLIVGSCDRDGPDGGEGGVDDAAESVALAATHGGTFYDAGLSGELIGGTWRAVWNVAIDNPGCSDVQSCASNQLLVKIDATDGTVIEMQARCSSPGHRVRTG